MANPNVTKEKEQANCGANKKYEYLDAGVWRNGTLEFVPKQGVLSTGRYEYSLKDQRSVAPLVTYE